MRRRLATTRITLRPLQVPESAQTTELNYRTRITTFRQDVATMVRLASILTIVFIATSIALRLFSALPIHLGFWILVLIAFGFFLAAYTRFLFREPPWGFLGLAAASLIFIVLFAAVHFAPTMRAAYLWVFCPAVAGAATFAHFVTFQILDFMAVNERIRRRTMLMYRRIARELWSSKTIKRCPELWPYRASFALLGVALAFGFWALVAVEQTDWADYAAMAGVLAFLASLPTLWLASVWFEEKHEESLWETARTALWGLSKFLCYNRHKIDAAGLFRFPTELLRPPLHRDIALGLTLVSLSTAVIAVSISSPSVTIERYWQSDPSTPEPPPVFSTSPVEDQYAATLSESDRAAYYEAKRRDFDDAGRRATYERIWNAVLGFCVAVIAVLVLAWLGPLIVLFAVLWFTSGRILNRFHRALEHAKAYEVPPEPSEKQLKLGGQGYSIWANRIQRIQWSKNRDEREHFYLGTSMEGDFPIYLHEKILHTHAHLLGDTGSGKTALGIAPVLTQLIAREDCSVVILDLKGDITLFETCRIEAENNGLPFKYFTNIPGRASHVFNPFYQSHVPLLTSAQVSQGMLQALALEYGEDYGRGFFSALNEIVLTTYMRHDRKKIHSFRDLVELVSDKKRYQDYGGNADDWDKTRHLASVVDKLAQVGPLNATEATLKDKPKAFAEQIDMAGVLKAKQVVYFYLSTPIEPTTVSPVAKLAMFSLLTAAARRGKGEKNRVYVFIDEFQRVVSENLKLFLEQARSFRLHFILANQTIGQLNRTGIDLTDVVESCTAYKQSFRASDEKSIKRLIASSGDALYHSVSWTQVLTRAFDPQADDALSVETAIAQSRDPIEAKVSEHVSSRLEKNTIIDVSAMPLASFVKFSQSSGFSQFGGEWTPLLSEYHIARAVYDVREDADWPDEGESTIVIHASDEPSPRADKFGINPTIPKPLHMPAEFEGELEDRLKSASRFIPTPPPTDGKKRPKGR